MEGEENKGECMGERKEGQGKKGGRTEGQGNGNIDSILQEIFHKELVIEKGINFN